LNPIFAVTITVGLGLASALLLKAASSLQQHSWHIIGLLFLAALFVNGLRFAIWGHVHKKHPISLSYPLASTFFPLILLVGHFIYDEPFRGQQVVGAIIIMFGVGMLALDKRD
jgi:drug/metabolite transporter (DMT)-like permease